MSASNKNVLIVGGSGFIGRNISEYLKKRRAAAKNDLDKAVGLGLPRATLTELHKQCD